MSKRLGLGLVDKLVNVRKETWRS